MPTASDYQRALMAKWFPSTDPDNSSGVNDGPPYAFLIARGWTEKSGLWSKPTSFHNPSMYEVECLLFLRDEWDYDFTRPLYQELPQ